MLEILYEVGKILLTLYLYFISYFYTLSVPLSWTTPVRLIGIYMCTVDLQVDPENKN